MYKNTILLLLYIYNIDCVKVHYNIKKCLDISKTKKKEIVREPIFFILFTYIKNT